MRGGLGAVGVVWAAGFVVVEQAAEKRRQGSRRRNMVTSQCNCLRRRCWFAILLFDLAET
jgi:hypothetical protein